MECDVFRECKQNENILLKDLVGKKKNSVQKMDPTKWNRIKHMTSFNKKQNQTKNKI